MTDDQSRQKVQDLITSTKVAMLTTVDREGRLVGAPMATQEADLDGEVWFITERSADLVANIEADPRVNLAYVSGSSWLSLAGTAEVVHDTAKLAELWNSFTDAWLEGGPENPENVLVRVRADTAEYWDSPGAKVVQLANLVKAKVTGERYQADNEIVDL